MQLSEQRGRATSRAQIEPSTDSGRLPLNLNDVKVRPAVSREIHCSLFTVQYVNGVIRMQQKDDSESSLQLSPSAVSDCLCVCGPGLPGEPPIV